MENIKTLKDLEFWCLERNIPLEKARFALGEDKTEKRWFGIYQNDNGEWVVYKNKDDGTRFIRYQGESEEEAVRILFNKIKEEVRLRKTDTFPSKKKKKKNKLSFKDIITIIGYIFAVIYILLLIVRCSINNNKNGYYEYKGKHFYRKQNDWYYYDPYINTWYPDYYTFGDDIFYDDYEDYYIGKRYDSNDDYSNFKDSDYYNDSSNDSYYDDDDYDYSWDSDSSWDSFDTDWGSDW